MFFSIKYKENQEKNIKLFGSIKEKCYFCKRVEILASRDSGIWAQTSSLYKIRRKGSERTKVSNI